MSRTLSKALVLGAVGVVALIALRPRARLRARLPESSAEALLDAAVQYTFPASDPIAVQNAYAAASRRDAAAKAE